MRKTIMHVNVTGLNDFIRANEWVWVCVCLMLTYKHHMTWAERMAPIPNKDVTDNNLKKGALSLCEGSGLRTDTARLTSGYFYCVLFTLRWS